MLSRRLLPARSSLRQLCAFPYSQTSVSLQRTYLPSQTARSFSTSASSSTPPAAPSSSSSSSSSPPSADSSKSFNPHSDANRLAHLDLAKFGNADATQIAQKILDEESERERYRKETRNQWITAQLTVIGVLGLIGYALDIKWVNPFTAFTNEGIEKRQQERQQLQQARTKVYPPTASAIESQVRAPTSVVDFLSNPLGSLASVMPKRKRDTPEEREKAWLANLESTAQAQVHTMKIEAQKHGRTFEEHQRIVEKQARSV